MSAGQMTRALVIGGSGAIGSAIAAQLRDAQVQVVTLSRQSTPPLDLCDENSVQQAALALRDQAPFQLIIHAAGVLHTADAMPEKKLGDLHMAQLQQTFMINTFGPALVLRYFHPLLDKQQGRMAFLSAKVGSTGDNRLGGWYSYRASKAALNMLVKTAAIEVQRNCPQQVLLALHPGTVQSALSAPFKGGHAARAPEIAAAELLSVIRSKTPADSGGFFSYDGQTLPW